MIWIDLANKRPTDADIPGWTPWTQGQWDAWLTKSRQLKAKLIEVRARVREMTSPAAELSAVARWCLLFRNDPQLSRLVG